MIQPNEVSEVTSKVYDLLTQAEAASSESEGARLRAQALLYSCDFLKRLTEDPVLIEYPLVTQKGDQESLRIEKNLKFGSVELVSKDPSPLRRFPKTRV